MATFGNGSDEPNKRAHDRYRVWLPVQVRRTETETEADEAMMVTYDASQRGLLGSTRARLSVGETVTLAIRVPPDAREARAVTGRIVRSGPNPDDPGGLWPRRVAIEFDEPLPDLEGLLRELERG